MDYSNFISTLTKISEQTTLDVIQASRDVLTKMDLYSPKTTPLNVAVPMELINWADESIDRCAIIPVVECADQTFICLGISRQTGNIISIGGSYDEKDLDLLSTAVREYNEEIGDSLVKISEKDLEACYAIKSDHGINIILPMKIPLCKLTETDELYNILWVTHGQFQIILDNGHLLLDTSKYVEKRSRNRSVPKAFSINVELKNASKGILKALKDKVWLNSDIPRHQPVRTKKASITPGNIIYTLNDFKNLKQKLGGLLYLIPIGEKCFLCDGYGRRYSIPIKFLDSLMREAIILRFDIFLSFNNDCEILRKYNYDNRISTVECSVRKWRTLTDQFEMLKHLRKISDVWEEMRLLSNIEFKLYMLKRNSGMMFCIDRALFLRFITDINIEITKQRNHIFNPRLNTRVKAMYDRRRYNYMIYLIKRLNLYKHGLDGLSLNQD